MADEKVFKIRIDGIEQSYKNSVKLLDALVELNKMIDNVNNTTTNIDKTITNSINTVKQKTKTLTEEEKAQKKLADTQDKSTRVITTLEKEQEKANQQLKERTEYLEDVVRLETSQADTIAKTKAQLKILNKEWENVTVGSEKFEELTAKIAELNAKLKEAEEAKNAYVGGDELETIFKNLGDTIDATTTKAQGMLNLFQAGVGFVLLFDEKNEALQNTMNKLGKVIAVVTALQSFNEKIIKKGTAATIANTAVEKIRTIQTLAAAKATELSTKNTLAASVAQKVFNLVAAANPYVLLAMALVSVIGALVLFSGNTEKAAEKQKKLNELQREAIELKNQNADALTQQSEQRIRELEREYELMQANGATEAQLAMKRRQINQQREKDALVIFNLFGKEASHLEENRKKADNYRKALEEINRAVSRREGKFKVEIDGEVKDLDTNAKEKIEQIKEYIEARLSNVNIDISNGLRAINAIDDARAKSDKDEANARKSAMEASKRSNIAMAEHRVLVAKKSSAEELAANKEAIKLRLKAELSSAEITKGERVKRTEEALQQISKLEEDFRNSQLQDEINLIDARLSLLEKGTEEEFTLRSELLEKQQQKELDNANLTELQKDAIRLKYESKFIKLEKEKAKYVSENEINTTISSINSRLTCVKKGTEEELNLRLELAEANARIAREDAVNNIANEKLKIAKLEEINAQWQKEKRELSVDAEVSNVENQSKKETLSLIQELEKRTISKREYEDKMLALSIESLQKEIDIRKKYGQDTTELEISLSEMRINQAENEKTKVTRYFEEMHANLQKITGNIMEGVTAIFDATNSIMQAQLDDANEKFDEISKKYDEIVKKREESTNRIQELEKQAQNARGGRSLVLQSQIEKEIEANKKLAEQEQKLAKDKEKLEKEKAKKEKQRKKLELAQNIIQGLVNIALGVTKAWSLGPLVGPAMAAVVSAAGAIQVGIMTKQLSKLEDGGLLKGKRHREGGMRVEGTNIEVEGGEYVINRISTNKNLGLIKYINSQRKELDANDINTFFGGTIKNIESPFRTMFESGGQLPIVTNTGGINREDIQALNESIQSINIEPVVSVVDINNAQTETIRIEDFAGI